METNNNFTGSIELFFRKYENVYNRQQFKEQATMFAKFLVAAGPQGAACHKNNFFTRMLYAWGLRKWYKKTGLESMKIIAMEQKPISNDYCLIKIHWGAMFEKTMEKLIQFDVSYVVRITGKMEIVMYIAHEDERKSLKALGIID